jgi:hypothetical protein
MASSSRTTAGIASRRLFPKVHPQKVEAILGIDDASLVFIEVLGHYAVYITVAFVWLYFNDDRRMDEEEVARRDDRQYGYQLAAMLCFLIFADNLLRRIEGSVATAWFWLGSGR